MHYSFNKVPFIKFGWFKLGHKESRREWTNKATWNEDGTV